jgi:hypothetical protein
MIFVSNHYSLEILLARPIDVQLSSGHVTPETVAVLSPRSYTVPFMVCDHVNTSALFEMLIKAIVTVSHRRWMYSKGKS